MRFRLFCITFHIHTKIQFGIGMNNFIAWIEPQVSYLNELIGAWNFLSESDILTTMETALTVAKLGTNGLSE